MQEKLRESEAAGALGPHRNDRKMEKENAKMGKTVRHASSSLGFPARIALAYQALKRSHESEGVRGGNMSQEQNSPEKDCRVGIGIKTSSQNRIESIVIE
ncbi:hypothetical protein N7532_004358 [Penicillium argentinense]|uniref:Uncharacterized protein n=1 Tax=Penicillium argentinense TaxID=1131581 RepID=A0A9W9KEU5_9EURO|nr:uncharacterized protein N7532_004358 [Penicillium argentinense]KAJ5103829.1 hypothetical protein N7532_004358 [Penicillium argentinense]